MRGGEEGRREGGKEGRREGGEEGRRREVKEGIGSTSFFSNKLNSRSSLGMISSNSMHSLVTIRCKKGKGKLSKDGGGEGRCGK